MTFDDSSCTLNIIEEKQSVPEEEKQFQLFFLPGKYSSSALGKRANGRVSFKRREGIFPHRLRRDPLFCSIRNESGAIGGSKF